MACLQENYVRNIVGLYSKKRKMQSGNDFHAINLYANNKVPLVPALSVIPLNYNESTSLRRGGLSGLKFQVLQLFGQN